MPKKTEALQEVVGESFQIVKTDNYSFNDLIRLQKEGESVVRTPHNGNWSIPNMLYALGGLRAVIYDRTYGAADVNYHPHTIIHDGMQDPIASPDILVSHAQVLNPNKSVVRDRHYAQPGKRLAHLHQSALEEAFPQVQLVQYSDYLQEHKELADMILQECINLKPELWRRYVGADGLTHEIAPHKGTNGEEPSPLELVLPEHVQEIFSINSETQGWLIPNTLNVLLMGVLEAITYGTNRVYHVSGPDMINYINNMQPDLDILYQAIRKKLQGKINLPEKLEFYLIPLASIRFATTYDNREALDQMISSQLEYEREHNARTATLLEKGGYTSIPGREFLQVYVLRTDLLINRTLEAIRACPEIFYTLDEGSYLSQYDVLEHGGLYVPEWVMHAPISEITRIYSIFNSMRIKDIAQQKRNETIH